jgi:hypothetical protein
MSLSDTLSSNKHQYSASKGDKYCSTRLLTHNGVTIAFALGRSKHEGEELAFFLHPAFTMG